MSERPAKPGESAPSPADVEKRRVLEVVRQFLHRMGEPTAVDLVDLIEVERAESRAALAASEEKVRALEAERDRANDRIAELIRAGEAKQEALDAEGAALAGVRADADGVARIQ